jgi:hypothetical protein
MLIGVGAGMLLPAPPSEPDMQISRIRLSSQQVAPLRRLMSSAAWVSSRLKSPCRVK